MLLYTETCLLRCGLSTAKHVRVVHAPHQIKYIALSYVWGQASTQTAAICGETLSADLPNVINDAIYATMLLGFQFLWVDKYCIHQQNEADKLPQIQQIDKRYHKAELIFVSEAGKDPSYSLPEVRPATRPKQP